MVKVNKKIVLKGKQCSKLPELIKYGLKAGQKMVKNRREKITKPQNLKSGQEMVINY